MRFSPIQFTFTVISSLVLVPMIAGVAQSQTPPKYSPFGYTFYNESRMGYEAPPVQMLRVGGGKRSADEKLKIGVSLLENKSVKSIKAVKFKAFIFRRKALDEALETIETPVVELDIQALAKRECDILILYADDIPLLAYKPSEEFLLEVAVAEVHYDDGTVWEAKNLPGKIDPSKVR
ncbi:MAG: hypothetical protein ND895_25440 [Pyrinomonadaceae bacterium]|nr:hypothetical protein [Pyrinomonadaceae bacterium]